MRLLREYLRKSCPSFIGIYPPPGHRPPDQLPEAVRTDVERAMDQTAKNSGMQLAVALNYGGRAELVDAFNRILDRVRNNDSRMPASMKI